MTFKVKDGLTVNNTLIIDSNGNVDGRDIAVDGAKLDGIEAGATADQTASEILTAIKTVDGTSSGLDADLLDGQHGSYYYSPANAPDPTLTINGDASGSATFTNLGNATLTLTVADDSHNHVISNVDGLQSALDGKLSTSGKAADSNLLDGYDSSRFFRRQAKANATVGPGWMTVAHSSGGRTSGEVIVTDGDSSDHAYVRIHWLRSYADSNFTVVNTGGHANRITGARVLYDTADNTYGSKYLQVYVTTSSNYEVNTYELGDITDYNMFAVVTPVIEDTKTGYSVHGSELTGLDTYGFAAEEGILAGGAIRSNTSMSVNGNTVWHAGNDGSGSGLDADTLDGQHASAFLTGNQTITLSGDLSGSGTTSINAQIAANVVGANELNVSGNGTTAQYLRSDGDGSFTWATPPDTNTTYSAGNGISLSGTTFSVAGGTGLTQGTTGLSISDNGVSAQQLNVSGNGTAGQALVSDGDGSFSWANAGGGWEVIASGGDTASTAVSSIEVTGLSDYQYVVGYLMAETSSSSDRLYLQFSTDSGAYTSLTSSPATSAGNDTYSSHFRANCKANSGYVSMIGYAYETTNPWSTTSGEIQSVATESQMSYPATTGITSIKWLVSGGTMQYWRYVVMGIK